MTRPIDADALKEVITAKYNSTDYGMFTTGIMEIIDNAPTVDTDLSGYSDNLWKTAYERGKKERPQGEWIFSGDNSYYCSLCKRSISTTLTRPTELFPFCHCGADMRGDKK